MAHNSAHAYQSCRDSDCPRLACRAWKDGHEAGYQTGFEDGIAACPREHK
jgi:hypothetical protein